MKRSGPPARKTPLKQGKPLERKSDLTRSAGLGRGKPVVDEDEPPIRTPKLRRPPARRKTKKRRLGRAHGWKGRVFDLRGDRCLVCGKRAVQAHHVVPRSKIVHAPHLDEQQRAALAYDERNGFPICVRCHERHEQAVQRILRTTLPDDAAAWAQEHEFGWYVDDRRIYPLVPPAWERP